MVPVISITGRSGAGKTTLIEKLVSSLSVEGVKIGVIKHTRHHIDDGDEGKDSWRYRQAGALGSVITSDRQAVAHLAFTEDVSPENLVMMMSPLVDLVIIEGYREGTQKKIEVIDESLDEAPLYKSGVKNIIALAADGIPPGEFKVFSRDDITGLADFIMKETGLVQGI
ncbi:MAG: molybdopterin-guanine dinucleotide biosynthesis protein B [Spirochaetota bacterium]